MHASWRVRSAAAALGVATILAGVSCSDNGGPEDPDAIPTTCGLPTPGKNVNASLVPEMFLADGKAQVAKVEKERGGFVTALNVPFSVNSALSEYRAIVKDGGYEIVSEDNEGFEAEIYFRGPKELGVVQIRRSACDDASVVFVNLISKRSIRPLPTPTPTPTRKRP